MIRRAVCIPQKWLNWRQAKQMTTKNFKDNEMLINENWDQWRPRGLSCDDDGNKLVLKMEAVFRPLSPRQTACVVCVTVATMVTATTVLRLGSGWALTVGPGFAICSELTTLYWFSSTRHAYTAAVATSIPRWTALAADHRVRYKSGKGSSYHAK